MVYFYHKVMHAQIDNFVMNNPQNKQPMLDKKTKQL